MKANFKKSLPKLWIISPAYNCADVAPLFVNSLKLQNYTNWECIIIDDASTDKTYEVFLNCIDKDPRFQVVRNEHNLGALHNRDRFIRDNRAIDNKDIIIYMDGDDWFGTKYAFEYLVKEYAVRDILVTTARNHCLRDGLEDDGELYYDRQQLLDATKHTMSLFSFPAWMWRMIPLEHMLDPRTATSRTDDGDIDYDTCSYYMSDEDPCFTFPILWMAGPKHHHHIFVDNFIIYNNIRPICDDYKVGEEGHKAATECILRSFHRLVENGLPEFQKKDLCKLRPSKR